MSATTNDASSNPTTTSSPAPVKWFRRIGRKTITLLVLSLAAVILSIVFEKIAIDHASPHADHGWWSLYTASEFMRETAFALAIAFGVIATIESESRAELGLQIKEHIRHIQDNVFKSTFERDIPRAIAREIDELVFKKQFARLEQTVHYNMKLINISDLESAINSRSKIVVVEAISLYIVENISTQAVPFPIRMNVEKPIVDDLSKFVTILEPKVETMERIQIAISGGKLTETEYAKHGSWETASISPGTKIRVETRSQLIKLPTDQEIWTSLYPSLGLQVYVSFPQGVSKYGATCLHKGPLGSRSIGLDRMEYELRGAILPHQGIVFWWACDPTLLHPTHYIDGRAAVESPP